MMAANDHGAMDRRLNGPVAEYSEPLLVRHSVFRGINGQCNFIRRDGKTVKLVRLSEQVAGDAVSHIETPLEH